MGIKSIELKNFTVFQDETIEFTSGLNVIVGPNGVGKSHLIKVIYAASKAADPKVSFPHKLVKCFLPDDYRIARLIRRQDVMHNSSIKVNSCNTGNSKGKSISMMFGSKTDKWNATVKGEKSWEEQNSIIHSVFIPAKEILSNSFNLNSAVEMNNVLFDDTYLDIINFAKIDITTDRNHNQKDKLLSNLEKIIGGTVVYDSKKDEFYLRQYRKNLEFPLAAEGVRKIALLWQLIKNGALDHGSILIWDEPEANLNPAYVPIIVDSLMELQRWGVQIFVSTHDYFMAKYIDIRNNKEDVVRYYSLYDTSDRGVRCETSDEFTKLEHNSIMDTFISLYREEIDKVME